LYSDRDTALYFAPHATNMLPEWNAKLFGFKVPTCRLDAGFRHSMAAHVFHCVPDVGRSCEFVSDDHRSQDLFGCHPCRIGPFVRIRRRFAAGDLTPALGSSSIGVLDAHQNYSPLIRAAKTGLEKVNEREIYFDQFDRSESVHAV